MQIFRLYSAILIGLCVLAAPTKTQAADSHVTASLIADVSAIHGSKPFTIAVLLEMERGWHVYWSNPGEGGLATTVKFKGPDGFTIAPDPLPVPRRMQQPTKEIIYGYDEPVLITAEVTPTRDVPIGQAVKFEADTSWLACKEACVTGHAALGLTLQGSDHADPVSVMPFERYLAPVTPASRHSPDVADVEAKFDPATHVSAIRVTWKSAARDIEVFPGADDALTVGEIHVEKTEGNVTPITLKIVPVPGQTLTNDRLTVLVAYRTADGKRRGFEVAAPVK